MQSNMRGRRASRKSNSSDSLEIQNENSTLTQRKYNVLYSKMDVSDTEHKGKRKQCFSKNAVMARMNRLRKKKFLENLQSNLTALSEENVKLKDTVNRQSKLLRELKNEILYLRNVVANSKELGMLLKSVSHNTGLPARSSLLKGKPELESQPEPEFQFNGDVGLDMLKAKPEPERQPEPELQPEPEFQFNGDVGLDSFPLDTLSSSRATESDLQSEDTNFDYLFPVNSDLLSIDNVILSSSMPNDNVLDLALLTSDNASSDLMENNNSEDIMDINCSPVLNGTTVLNEPVVINDMTQSKTVTDNTVFANVGVCLHVAKQKVSLEFCARCNKNANKVWSVGVAEMPQ